MAAARSGEIELAVERLRLYTCLIRSVRVERIIGRRSSPLGVAIARDPA